MENQEFTLQLGVPKVYRRQWKGRYNGRCNNSDGLNSCDCMAKHGKAQELCCFYGRSIEPLAFSLPPFFFVNQQDHCPLYRVLPKELRDMIWKYALSGPDDGTSPRSSSCNLTCQSHTKANPPNTDIAFRLLETCKAVYLETYRLPILLHGYLTYFEEYQPSLCPDLGNLTPWQYALIERLEYSWQSANSSYFIDGLARWNAALRHAGAYVAPRFYSASRRCQRTKGVTPSHDFGLFTPPGNEATRQLRDGDRVTLPEDEFGKHNLQIRGSFTARAMVARPLTHLIIRVSRQDWSGYYYHPDSINPDEQLALDPACGRRKDPHMTMMVELAAQRRKGEHPEYEGTWGAGIGKLPDLKTFELILETFAVKKRQLMTVVECAKTWKFPLEGMQYELVHDGKVEELRWAKPSDEADRSEKFATESDQDSQDGMDTGTEYPRNMNPEDEEAADQVTGSPEPPPTNPSPLQIGSWSPLQYPPPYGSFNENHTEDTFPSSPAYIPPVSPPFSPTSPPWEPRSPVYSPWDTSSSQDLRGEPWMRSANEFEVRIMRFGRRRRV